MTENTNGLKALAEYSKQQHTPSVLLSVKQLEELGNELNDIMNALEMNNLTLEGLQFIQDNDATRTAWHLRKYISIAYRQNEKLYDRLDKIAFLLLNNGNAKELGALEDER
ncbi:TPA: hypothetical protein TZS89_002073 [Streptococcus suis]|nr:hypothetical protein [Streptococcus suis]